MGDKRLLSISILILSVSIVFGAVWMGSSLEKLANASAGGTSSNQ